MKSVLEYLSEQKDMAWHNRLCYTDPYGINTPKEGQETQFAESIRDCEIIDELIELVKRTIKLSLAKDAQSQTPVLTYAATAEELQFIQELEQEKNLQLSPEDEAERREYARAALNFSPSEGQRKLLKKLNIRTGY